MKLKVLLALFFAVLATGAFVPKIYAIDLPSFPSCVSINGTLKVSYDSGVHGIVGDPSVHQGSDKVYLVGDSNLTQCFCSESGAGIQTNWWKVSSLDQEQIDQLTKQGWTYIPNGSAWGLDDSAYMAQNSSYSCNSSNDGGGGNGGGSNNAVCNTAKPPAPQLISVVRNGATAKLTWSAVTPVTYYSIVYGTKPGDYVYGVANVGNTTSYTVGSLDPNSSYYFSVRAVNDCTPSDPSTSPRGQVLGASTFAGTGNIVLVYASIVLSLAFLLLGIYFKRREV